MDGEASNFYFSQIRRQSYLGAEFAVVVDERKVRGDSDDSRDRPHPTYK